MLLCLEFSHSEVRAVVQRPVGCRGEVDEGRPRQVAGGLAVHRHALPSHSMSKILKIYWESHDKKDEAFKDEPLRLTSP